MTATAKKAKNHSQLNIKVKENDELSKDTPAISGRELIDLLYPITPEAFTTEYWCSKSLFIKGRPKKLQKLFPGGFERKDFYRAVRRAALKKIKGYQLLARSHQGLFSAGNAIPYEFIEPDQMESMFASVKNLPATDKFNRGSQPLQ